MQFEDYPQIKSLYCENHDSLIPVENLQVGHFYKMDIPYFISKINKKVCISIYAKLLKIDYYPQQPYIKIQFSRFVDDAHQNLQPTWDKIGCPYNLSHFRNVSPRSLNTAKIIYCLQQKYNDDILPANLISDIYEYAK